jgi:formylglycine-generating enzyme required for sulfatase activity
MNSPTNPYIAGNPITGTEMFFGRRDVFHFVRETLVGRYQDNAIVLYGGRRTGKTSVLYQIGRHLDPRYVPVFVDLQGISLEGLGEMLWGISRQATRVLRRQKGIELNVPARAKFAVDPEGCFRGGFLIPALEALGDDHLLFLLDEAARLYEQVHAGRLEPRVFDFLRSLIQYHPRLNFIFSIGSGLEEMRQEYALLFNLCQYRKISFLDQDAAEALIVEPVKEHYRYAPGAMERILEVTHGHPYYTQLVCNRLFARWARQQGDEVTVSDVEAVLDEAAEQGMASLQYAWEEASDVAKVVLAALTKLMADGNQPIRSSDLRAIVAAQEIDLSRHAVNVSLQELVAREVLYRVDGGYMFTVDLMRLWVQQYQRLEWVKGKIPPPKEPEPPAERDWVRLALVGVSAGLLFLLIGLSVIFSRASREAELARVERQANATAMSGTIAALETKIALGTGSRIELQTLQAERALAQTQIAVDQATQQVPTNTPVPTATSTPTPVPTPTDVPSPLTTPTPEGGSLGDIWTRPADGMMMVYVPDGTFQMGSTVAEIDAAFERCEQRPESNTCRRSDFEDEFPQHSVTLDDFWIDQTEVTNAQYRRCVEAGSCEPPEIAGSDAREAYYRSSEYDEYPVLYISSYQAAQYCAWAEARLPTEAEWEYAAGGPEERLFPWGDEFDGTRLNYCDVNCTNNWADKTADDGYADTAPVENYPEGVSWCGALDMAGNVFEWAADWYGSYPAEPQINPSGPSSGEYRVIRGGSWDDAPYQVRTANRYELLPNIQWADYVGFRCAQDVESASAQ